MKSIVMLLSLSVTVLAAGPFPVGVIDTVGGTTYDDQNSGPALQWVLNDPAYGIHVTWMYSNSASSWPDRTMQYNFFDKTLNAWNWIDPDFMVSGVNSQIRKTGFGTLDLDPASGAACIAAHYAAGMPDFTPVLVEDLFPGAGLFSEWLGEPDLTGYFLPVIARPPDGSISLLLILFAASDNLYYVRSTEWGTWGVPSFWNVSGGFGHNLVASRASNKLLATWMSGSGPEIALSYRFSSDGGANWDNTQALTPPSAFGGDSGTVCFIGATAMFDKDDNWRLVTTLVPLVADSALQNPAQLWVYNSGTSQWSFIRGAGGQNLSGEIGENAAYCGRPSLGQNPLSGTFYCAWEEFDSTNFEPTTGRLRADIFAAASPDGVTWSAPTRLTNADATSKRFPFIARNCSGDSLAIGFEQDSIAGFNTGEVGAISRNPICVWRGTGVGSLEETSTAELRTTNFGPSIARGVLRLPVSQFTINSSLFDMTGRRVMPLVPGPNDVSALSPGVYFVRETKAQAQAQAVRKVIIAQ
ncbi:T9SS type A sorting domain-containing protein [candidate division WOR-3 bacterium]|nr:T9SS type A sorting domain-containing protein [candidate division WOR-3 bacterium]